MITGQTGARLWTSLLWLLAFLVAVAVTNQLWAAELTIADGVVVKFDQNAGLVARDRLVTDGVVVFTSVNDNSIGGSTVTGAPAPQPGDWRGIAVEGGALVNDVHLDRATIRYAGSGNGAALKFSRVPYVFDSMTITDSLIGVRIDGGGSASMTGLSLFSNVTGVLVEGNATPRITGSEIVGNSLIGIDNRTPATTVIATANWWGHASGPHDPVANPGGQGDGVSPGVDYGQYLTDISLVGCRVDAANDQYNVNVRTVTLRLTCRNALEYRLAESSNFGSVPFSPMTSLASFTLSPAPGSKLIYAQFRRPPSQGLTVTTPQPFIYTPSIPSVNFLAPAAGAVLTGNTQIQVTASDPVGIASVEFRAGTQLIGTDTGSPFETTWDVSSVADGVITLTAIATNAEGRTGQATRVVTLERISPQPDTYQVNEGNVLFVDAPGILVNDHVVSPVGLIVDPIQLPAWGQVHLANDGSFVFQPDTPDRNGVTTFQYRLRSNGVTSIPVTVTITVLPVNDPPSPIVDNYLTDENVQLEVLAPGVLDNDDDIDSTSLHAQIQTPPLHGVLQLLANGSFTYVPEVNFRGPDSFQYVALDDQGAGTTATAHIMVTQPPTATNDVYFTDANTPLTVSSPDDGLIANDHDAPENDVLTAILDREPEHGILTLSPNGTFNYVPDMGFIGLDHFTYQVTDGRSRSNIASVTLGVGVFSLPQAVPDSYTIDEDQELIVPAINGVLSNDRYPANSGVGAGVVFVSSDGIVPESLVMTPDGGFRVRFGQDFSGDTFFVYQAYNNDGTGNSAIVTLHVVPVNDGVEANDDRFGVSTNTVFTAAGYGRTGAIQSNDRYDIDFTVNFGLVAPAQHGLVELNTVTGGFRYTPQGDFSGTDTFTYRVFQVTTGVEDTAVVTLRTNAPPVAIADSSAPISEDSVDVPVSNILANDFDPDGDPFQLTSTLMLCEVVDGLFHSGAIRASATTQPATFTASMFGSFYGTSRCLYFLTDGTEIGAGYLTLTVLPVPDSPSTLADEYLTRQNGTLNVMGTDGVLKNDFDPDTRPAVGKGPWPNATGLDLEPLRAVLVSTTGHGTLTLQEDGGFGYVPAADYSGQDQFVYKALDATGRESVSTAVTIRVNSRPLAVDDVFAGNEDAILVVESAQGLLANDHDLDGDSLITIFTPGTGCGPCFGQLLVRQDGGFRYTPGPNFNGTDEFLYRVSDGIAGFDTGHVVISILPVNDAPVTEPDTYRTSEDVILNPSVTLGVLRNDREVDGEQLVNTTLIHQAMHGAVIVGAGGGFGYTPNANFNGRDSFVYRVFDESNLYTDEDVEIVVTAVNDAPDAVNDSYSVDRDQTLVATLATGVLANDSDVDGPGLVASVVSPPSHGVLQLATDGHFTYQPDGVFVGVDQFQYQVDDGLGAVDSAAVSIVVRDVGSPVSITVADDFYAVEGAELTVPAPGVLGNDSVIGAPTLTASIVVPPQSGTLTLGPDGHFTYTAPPGFSGVRTFTYDASAGGNSELALVTLDVQAAQNVPPIAVGEQFGVLEDGLLDSRSSGGLLTNDSDFEGASLSLQMLTQPTHGVLDAQPDGQFLYSPNMDYSGSDTFTYRVYDGQVGSNTATASLTVFPQNDAPRVQDDSYQTGRDQSLTVAAVNGLLANDSDVDGDSIAVELVDSPIHGQVQVATNGGFVYQPAAGYVGLDLFRYAATDGSARSVGLVSVNVVLPGNQPPTAVGESFAVNEDEVLSSSAVGLLTANDTDPDGDALSVVLVAGPAHGTLTLDNAAFEYLPNGDYFGPDQFTYRVTDGSASAGPVAVSLTVLPVNDAPHAIADLYSVLQGQPLTVTALNGVLANDSDVENAAMTVTIEAMPGHGSVNLATNGSFTYSPNASFHGRDEFAYRVSDGGMSSVGRAVIDVTQALNQRPIAIGEVFSIPEDTVLDTRTLDSLLANDSDPDGQPLTFELLTMPPRGQLEVLSGGHVRYTPARDDTGTSRFDYTVSDGELQAVPVRVEIVLLPRNDAPQAQADLYSLAPQQPTLVINAATGVLANDVDPDGDVLIASVLQPPVTGSVNLGLDGSFVYTPAQPRPVSDVFTYRIVDPAGVAAEAQVTILLGGQPVGDSVFQSGFESSSR